MMSLRLTRFGGKTSAVLSAVAGRRNNLRGEPPSQLPLPLAGVCCLRLWALPEGRGAAPAQREVTSQTPALGCVYTYLHWASSLPLLPSSIFIMNNYIVVVIRRCWSCWRRWAAQWLKQKLPLCFTPEITPVRLIRTRKATSAFNIKL